MVSYGTGHGFQPDAHGATVINVTGSVTADLYVDTTACAASSLVIGDLVPGTDGWKTAQDASGQVCALTFGTTNNSLGADLTILEDPGAPASPPAAMKCISTCIGSALNDFDGGSEPAAGTSAFGAQLISASAGASAAWTTGAAVHAIADAGSTACQTSAPGDGTCNFTFGATAAITDAPGGYQAQAQSLVLAR